MTRHRAGCGLQSREPCSGKFARPLYFNGTARAHAGASLRLRAPVPIRLLIHSTNTAWKPHGPGLVLARERAESVPEAGMWPACDCKLSRRHIKSHMNFIIYFI